MSVADFISNPNLSDPAALHNFIKKISEAIENKKLKTFVPILPLMFQMSGKPYTLKDHFPFETLFNVKSPRRIVLKTGRQVSKSTSLASRGVLQSVLIPHFSTLYVTPLYEQIRRFSTRYVRPFIVQSPFKSLWLGPNTEDSVLQKSFVNNSKMFFSFCGLTVDRVRGIPANQCCFDEVQDIDYNHVPVILETMGGQKIRLELYAGTSKTLDNTLEGIWSSSSQAEWVIPCQNCKYENVPAMGQDIEKMIGPYRKDISEMAPGVICAKCRSPIHPRKGFWVHKFPERRWTFAGYHIPQIIMPIHYASPVRWGELLAKQNGAGGYTIAKFYNEVLGEAYDVGTKLINKTDLVRAACLPWTADKNNIHEIAKKVSNYDYVVMGIDWGGGGEEDVSYTTCAVVGKRPTGELDVIYGERLLTPHDHIAEAERLLQIFKLFGCRAFAHDYNGAGATRETIMIQAGLPNEASLPFVYYRSAAANIIVYKASTPFHPRHFWQIDKARSLVTLCQVIKLGYIKFFSYNFDSGDQTGLLHDFLSLTENKIQSTRGSDIYTIVRNPQMPDDFAHAVNFACASIWHFEQNWPNLAELARISRHDSDSEDFSPEESLSAGLSSFPS